MTEKINVTNPFLGRDPSVYQCFGCSPHNPIGLKLSFLMEGEEVFAQWQPQKQYEGYHNVVHGGIQATMLDEIASWFINVVLGTAGVTKKISVEYLSPAMANGNPLTLKASLGQKSDKEATIKTSLTDGNGKICTLADVTYALFPQAVAIKKFGYPGREAFGGQPQSSEK